MEDAPRQHAEVPHHVLVAEPPQRVEHEPDGIGEAAGEEEAEPSGSQRLLERIVDEKHAPPHQQVERDRDRTETLAKQRVADDARDGGGPQHGEEGPAHVARELGEGERRVGTGDEQVDARVVEHLEHRPRPRAGDTVIERRGGVEQHEAGAIDAAADHVASSAVPARDGDEDGEPGDAEHDAHAMCDAVGDLLAEGEATPVVRESRHGAAAAPSRCQKPVRRVKPVRPRGLRRHAGSRAGGRHFAHRYSAFSTTISVSLATRDRVRPIPCRRARRLRRTAGSSAITITSTKKRSRTSARPAIERRAPA